MAAYVDELCKTAVDSGASDLHLAATHPPVARINGGLQVLSDYPLLTPQSTSEILRSVTSDAEREIFSREKELDFS